MFVPLMSELVDAVCPTTCGDAGFEMSTTVRVPAEYAVVYAYEPETVTASMPERLVAFETEPELAGEVAAAANGAHAPTAASTSARASARASARLQRPTLDHHPKRSTEGDAA